MRGDRPVLCLITDRRRLTAALQEPETNWHPLLLSQIEGAIRGGVDVVQIREHDLDAAPLASLVREAVRLARGAETLILVNDRIDVAIAARANGAHLREAGIATSAVRELCPRPFVVGRSVHGADGVDAAGSPDYLIAGPVFATRSKPGLQVHLGLDGLRDVVSLAGSCPVWAIGGVTAHRIPALVAHGARGAAAIAAFLPAVGSADVATEVSNLTARMRIAFDSSTGVP
jgi:thiamine-phosphate pyrophosphorylase